MAQGDRNDREDCPQLIEKSHPLERPTG